MSSQLPVIDPARDPLGVLRSTRQVMLAARDVALDPRAIERVAADLASTTLEPPDWHSDLHWHEGNWRGATWVLVLDTLNFCFWSARPDMPRWQVAFGDRILDGYWALAAALRRAVDEGFALWDVEWQATVDLATVRHLLRPVAGSPEIPLLEARLANPRELGWGLLQLRAEQPDRAPIETLLERADHSAVALVRLVVALLPSFRDVAFSEGQEIHFYKRAQILIADLVGAFDGRGFGAFTDLELLTAFADYKVPQVLRNLGIIRYSDALAARIASYQQLPAGSSEEVEIRAATIWGCELLRQSLQDHGRSLHAFEIDWLLWSAGQTLPTSTAPYHRTLTMYY